MNYLDEMATNTADEAAVKAADLRAKEAVKRAEEDLRFVMSEAPGRRFINSLLERSRVFATVFAGEQPLTMSFNEGQRMVGNALLHDVMRSCHDLYLTMMREANDG